jgi:hypothetical protein
MDDDVDPLDAFMNTLETTAPPVEQTSAYSAFGPEGGQESTNGKMKFDPYGSNVISAADLIGENGGWGLERMRVSRGQAYNH